jgi:hypothetical protein
VSAGIGGLLPSLSTATFHGRNGRLAWASFVSDDKSGGVAAIATFSARGGGIDPINSCSDVNDFGDLIYCEDWDRISYSPDGRWLMWDMTATAGNEVIALANADGGALQVIDHGSTRMISSRPSLRMATGSPMSGEVGSEGQIVTSNLLGGDVRVVTTTITGFSP